MKIIWASVWDRFPSIGIEFQECNLEIIFTWDVCIRTDLDGIFSQNAQPINGLLHFFPASSNEVSVSEQLFRISLEKAIAISK